MPSPSDFRLYHSNSLEVLAGLLAQELRTPAPGQPLLAPDRVLIPQVAMRRWLQATLAQAHGIAANLEFLTPGELVQRALDANLPGTDDDLDADGLHWRLYAALTDPAVLRDPALRPLRGYLDGDDALRPWSLAGELASVFEKYQAWRRDWLLGWEAGQAPRDPQAVLWRRIAGGRAHRARRIDDYLARHAGIDAPLPRGLPARLFAFATLNVSPDVLRVIATQARVGTLHFYLPTPTRKYWGDLRTLGERLRDPDAAAAFLDDTPLDDTPFEGVPLEGEPLNDAPPDSDSADDGAARGDAGDDENPLLQAWGRAGRDFVALLGGYEAVHPSGEIEAYADPHERVDDDPARDSLLQRLQRDLLHRRAPARPAFRAAVDVADPSLQVHACHTRLREVQVLHDQLRALLENDLPDGRRFDPPLQPREIAVLAPDIDPYAPYIAAVFGGEHGRADFIPYALADTSPLVAEPLAEVFVRLLALPVSRFGLHEVLDLLATPAIAEPAGLDAPALDRLRDWLHAAGARWGLDAAHRERLSAPRDDAYTWSFALDRLLLGYASGDDAPIAGVAPWPGLEGGALDALDALVRLLRVLARHERLFASAMPPAQWRERLLGLLDALLPQPPQRSADQRTLERLRTLVEGFADAAQRAGFDAPVPPEVVRAHVHAALAQADTRAPLLTGGVSFGRMVPMRLLPFRVLCVLGMNDGDYPRRDPAGGLNQLTAELGSAGRRRGDRSLRDDDRFLFLQLLAAAADVFYLSYLGADPRDGSEREPSVLVSELLDTAARYHADADAARTALVVRHPLQGFSPAAFGAAEGDGRSASTAAVADTAMDGTSAGAAVPAAASRGGPASAHAAAGEPRRFSYLAQWHPAAAAGNGARREVGPWLQAPLEPTESAASLSLVELRGFLRDPPAAFLRQRLGLRLPEEADSADDTEPLVLPGRGLQRHQLQQAVFEACVRGDDDPYDGLRARALLPSGPLGRRQFEQLLAQVRPYADAFVPWRGAQAPQARTFELDLGDVRLHGRLDALYPAGLARLRFDPLNGPTQIAHGLDWLLLSALGIDAPLAQFAQFDGDVGPLLRAPLPAPRAQALLRELVTLRAWGLREPLPFLPRAGWLWYLDQDGRGWTEAGKQWDGGRGWGEGRTASASLALRGRDPFAASFGEGDGDNDADAAQAFRAIARQVFDAVVHGRSAEADA